jgi:hypothetical protein
MRFILVPHGAPGNSQFLPAPEARPCRFPGAMSAMGMFSPTIDLNRSERASQNRQVALPRIMTDVLPGRGRSDFSRA